MAQPVKNLPAMQEIWVGKIPWKRERLPTPVFWPGEFHGLYSPWGHNESDVTFTSLRQFGSLVSLLFKIIYLFGCARS